MTSSNEETVSLTLTTQLTDGGRTIEVPRTLGPVRLIEEIGRGGMGVVYLAHHELLDRSVAVKFLHNPHAELDEAEIQTFLLGARSGALVTHPRLVATYHADVIDGLPYLVTQYVHGATLSHALRQLKALSIGAAVYAMRGVADAVSALHHHGILHRDIKPSNILVDDDANLFVTDFGLAVTRPLTSIGPSISQPSGTPVYMAPEAFTGESSQRTDVYAQGITLFELLTGSPPYRSDSLEEFRHKQIHEPFPRDDLVEKIGVHPLVDVVERATYTDPAFRYKTAGHFLRALHSFDLSKDLLEQGKEELRIAVRGSIQEIPETLQRASSSKRYYESLDSLATSRRNTRLEMPATPQRDSTEPGDRIETPAELVLRQVSIAKAKLLPHPLVAVAISLLVGLAYVVRRCFFPSWPLWKCILLISVPFALSWIAIRTMKRARPPVPPPGFCLACGYDLVGNTTGICSECGTDRYDLSKLRRCPICNRRYPRKANSRCCRKCGFDPESMQPRQV